MELQLLVEVGMIFPGIKCQGRNVDRDVKDAEEGQGQHGGYNFRNGVPPDQLKIWRTVSNFKRKSSEKRKGGLGRRG